MTEIIFFFTRNPSLKDKSIYLAEEVKTEIRKTENMMVSASRYSC